jgi:hypothetical protein
MSLHVCVDDPAAPRDAWDRHFMRPAGFESYRQKLWGTPAIRRRSALLAEIEGNLYLLPNQFDEFEAQCKRVDAEADEIARELGWRARGASSIRNYMQNFLDALRFAREHGSDSVTIW